VHACLWMDGVSGGVSPAGRPRETLPSEDCMSYGMHCVVLYVACDGGGGLARHSQHWLCRAKNTLMNSMLFNSGRSVPCAMLAQCQCVLQPEGPTPASERVPLRAICAASDQPHPHLPADERHRRAPAASHCGTLHVAQRPHRANRELNAGVILLCSSACCRFCADAFAGYVAGTSTANVHGPLCAFPVGCHNHSRCSARPALR
jgi:hypothetical protein